MALRSRDIRIQKILKDAIKAPILQNIIPMSFKINQSPFTDEAWQFEIKWDGFRMVSYNQGSKVELRSRNNKSFDQRFTFIKKQLQLLNINAILDGEVVTVDQNGCSDFDRLMGGEKECLVYYVFDILWYNGYNVMDLPLARRRELLKEILPPSEIIRFSDHVDTTGEELFKLAKNHRVEGIVAKNKYSHYLPGIRTSQWLKIKTAQEREGIVAGLLLDREKHGIGFSSLIVGVREAQSYKYIGLVEAGINQAALKNILTRGKAINKSIFSPVPNVNRQAAFRTKIKNPEIIWLEPTIRCNVKYLELDRFGIMRHAAFKGLVGS